MSRIFHLCCVYYYVVLQMRVRTIGRIFSATRDREILSLPMADSTTVFVRGARPCPHIFPLVETVWIISCSQRRLLPVPISRRARHSFTSCMPQTMLERYAFLVKQNDSEATPAYRLPDAIPGCHVTPQCCAFLCLASLRLLTVSQAETAWFRRVSKWLSWNSAQRYSWRR